jgi:hypothetical protein
VLPLDGVAIGATLGAISGGAIASQPSTPAAVYHLERRDRPAS